MLGCPHLRHASTSSQLCSGHAVTNGSSHSFRWGLLARIHAGQYRQRWMLTYSSQCPLGQGGSNLRVAFSICSGVCSVNDAISSIFTLPVAKSRISVLTDQLVRSGKPNIGVKCLRLPYLFFTTARESSPGRDSPGSRRQGTGRRTFIVTECQPNHARLERACGRYVLPGKILQSSQCLR